MSGRNYNSPYPHSPKPKGTKWIPKKRSFRHIQEKETESVNLWQLHNDYPFSVIKLDEYQTMVVKLSKTRDVTTSFSWNSIRGNTVPGFLSDIWDNLKTFKYIEVAEVHQREKLIEHYTIKLSKLHVKQFDSIKLYKNIIEKLEFEIEEYYENYPEKFV